MAGKAVKVVQITVPAGGWLHALDSVGHIWRLNPSTNVWERVHGPRAS